MRKEIYIDEILGDRERPRRGRDEHRGFGEGFHHHDKGRGKHIHGGRRDSCGPHFEEGCNSERHEHPHHRVYKRKFYKTEEIMKTKMFSSKKELVDYVNEVGETGQRVDIFKIEDDLYKVVTYGTKEVKEEE